MTVRMRKAKKVPTLIRWSTTLLVMGVYFALGIIYIIPGLGIFRLAQATGVAEASVTVGFGLRSLARMIVGNLTRSVLRKQMLCLGYGCVAVILSISTATIPWINYIYVLLAMFICHGMCFAYVKNTSRMVLRDLWANRLPTFIKARNYHFLAGAMLGPFLAFPPNPQAPLLPHVAYLMCTYTETKHGQNDTQLNVSCHRDVSCFKGWTPQVAQNSTTTSPVLTTTKIQPSVLPVVTPTSIVVKTYTSCSKLLSPERGFVSSLTSFETQYLLAGWVALVVGLTACFVLFYYQKALAARKKGKGVIPVKDEDLTGTKLDILPSLVRKPVQIALEKVGWMKYIPKTVDKDSTSARESKLDYLPGPLQAPVRRILELTGLMKLGSDVSDTATGLSEKLKDKVGETAGKVEKKLEEKEKKILEEEERAKSGNVEDLKAGAMGKVAAGIAGIAEDVVKKKPGDEEGIEVEDKDPVVTRSETSRADPEAAKPDDDSDSDDDEEDEGIDDLFQIVLAIFMSVVMGLSAVITYTNFIAKYLMTLGASGLECSAITSLFGVCVAVGCTVVVSLYKKFKIYKVLFISSIVATAASAMLCFYGQYYYVCWVLTAVFGLFAGKIQEGVEELADDYDILSDEFEGIMDRGESIVLAIIPTAMGYLMAWEPKSLFYVTAAAFAICTAFLAYIPTTVVRLEKLRRRKRGIEEDVDPGTELTEMKHDPPPEVYEHYKGQNLLRSLSDGEISAQSRSRFLKWLDYY